MADEFISLFIIALVAVSAPVIARLVPRQALPETVLLVVAGALLGPNMANIVHSDWGAISLLSDLGCAFLFLLAGYEIDSKILTGKDGRHGLATWIVTLIAALILCAVIPQVDNISTEHISVALLFTTTALGALLPILKERGLADLRIGKLIISYGTWGELGPVLAMAIMLSARSQWQTAAILIVLFLLCVLIARLGKRQKESSSALYRFLVDKAETTSQTAMRFTVLMLIALVAFSAIFDIDIVLGAFAAGFVLRYLIPKGAPELETKLDGAGYGFFIPLFFVVSGCKINLSAVAGQPLLLLIFIAGLVLVRCVPIVVSLTIRRQTREELQMHSRLSISFYCTTALPLIVAITGLATGRGLMSEDISSVLVSAGALSMFLMPLFGSIAYRVADSEPLQAVKEIRNDPSDARQIIAQHVQLERDTAKRFRDIARMRIAGGLDAIGDAKAREQFKDMARKHAKELREVKKRHRDEMSELYKSHQDWRHISKEARLAIYDEALREQDFDSDDGTRD